jgi:hypothetical protein
MADFIRQIAWTLYRFITIFKNEKLLGQTKGDQFEDLPEAPYLLLSNHANFLDPWFFAQYSKKSIGIMVNEDAMLGAPFAVFMRRDFVGMFPKKKGASDPKAIKETIKRIKRGQSVLIFPEGQTTWDGETQPIYAGIEKIAKKMKIPIVLHNLEGNFLLNPWWAKSKRKGGIVTNRKVITTQQIEDMSVEEIRDDIISYISTNDVKNDNNLKIPFSGENLTSGMERVLWVCPECGAEDKLTPEDNSMVCSSCNCSFEFNAHLRLVAPLKEKNILDFYDWHQMQIRTVLEKLKNSDTTLAEDEFVSLVKLDYRGRTVILDTGKLSLNSKQLTFAGADGTLEFPINEMDSPVFSQKTFLLFTHKRENFRFVIEKSPLFKWVTYLREATGYREAFERKYY